MSRADLMKLDWQNSIEFNRVQCTRNSKARSLLYIPSMNNNTCQRIDGLKETKTHSTMCTCVHKHIRYMCRILVACFNISKLVQKKSFTVIFAALKPDVNGKKNFLSLKYCVYTVWCTSSNFHQSLLLLPDGYFFYWTSLYGFRGFRYMEWLALRIDSW